MSFVEFRDVRKIYGSGELEVRASDGLNFVIEEGEIVVIVGPSGSGKTTLLNMLGGMRFLDVKVVPSMVCPYCGDDFDMEIGPDETVPDNLEAAMTFSRLC